MALDENYYSFMNELRNAREIANDSTEKAFVDDRCSFLVDQGVLQDYHLVNYADPTLNIQIDAWGFIPTQGNNTVSLAIIVSDFHDEPDLVSQTISEFRSFMMKGKRFLMHSLKDGFSLGLAENSPEACFSQYLHDNQEKILSVQLIGITNSVVTSHKNSLIISENSVQNICFSFDVWDFARFNKIEVSAEKREQVNIDFANDYGFPKGIPALRVANTSPEIDTFLFVLSGQTLIDLYANWNERLLEQNPRTFLQFTGKINKGIRNTIWNEPEKFFSYNNGLSAVANRVSTDANGNILSIENLQIVNGGQTTASLYNTAIQAKRTKREIKIEALAVMVKLSVIKNNDAWEQIIPKISEYSNSQNKVNSSSFSVRHPFHKAIEDYSRRIFTPSKQGRIETHWYYERVLGQYKNAINLKLTNKEKTIFELENPKTQVIKKEELAKYLLTFDNMPYKVCLGSQKCYAVFCSKYLKSDEEDQGIIDASVNDIFYKNICAKAILYRSLEKCVPSGARFVLVPYTLATVNYYLQKEGNILDFQRIWGTQWDNGDLIDLLVESSNLVNQWIMQSQPLGVSLVSEWGKKEECWKNIITHDFAVNQYNEFCVDSTTQKKRDKEALVIGRTQRELDSLSYVIGKGSAYWVKLGSWLFKNGYDDFSKNMVQSATKKFPLPTERQAKQIIQIEQRAIKEGFPG